MANTTSVEVTEAVTLNIKDKSALGVSEEIEHFVNQYGQFDRHMWKIVNWDISSIKLSRRYTKELKND